MNNKILNLGFLLGSALSPLLLQAAAKNKTSEIKRPNILVLMTDDQTYKSIHAMGNNQVLSPNMDKLVMQGVTFTNHYATTSISMASRACLMTGMYEYKTGCNFDHGPLAPEKFEKSYPVLLRKAGYYTGFGGKLGFAVTNSMSLSPDFGNKDEYLPSKDFDSWAGVGHLIYYPTIKNTPLKKYASKYPHLTRALGAYAMDFLDKASTKNKPFCLSIYFKSPHNILTPDSKFKEIYADTKFAKPANFGFIGDTVPKQALIGRQYTQYFPHYTSTYESNFRKYYQLVYGVDYVIGELRNKLKQLGMEENTIIIFTSDNGFSMGSHALYAKLLPYEECSKVPLIIYDPKNTSHSGMQSRSLTANVDVTSTILDYAGVKQPENMDGESLVPIVNNPAKSVRFSLPSINTWGAPQEQALSINTKNWKYTYWGFAEGMDIVETLYNKKKDPMELHNLAKDPKYKIMLNKMRNLYDARLAVWKSDGVKTGGYPNYPILFSRRIPWSTRKEYIGKYAWAAYQKELDWAKYNGNDIYNYDKVLEFVKKRTESLMKAKKAK